MPNYNQAHQFYAGVDLHARSMFVHVVSAKGKTVFARDLLRRRSFFVRQRSQLITHIVNTNSQFNLPPFAKKLSYAANRSAEIAERFTDPSTRLMIQADLHLIDGYDAQILELERHLLK